MTTSTTPSDTVSLERRLMLARRPDTSLENLTSLAEDTLWEVRRTVASRQDLSDGMVLKLVFDRHYSVREAACAHPLSDAVFERLLSGPDLPDDLSAELADCLVVPPEQAVAQVQKLACTGVWIWPAVLARVLHRADMTDEMIVACVPASNAIIAAVVQLQQLSPRVVCALAQSDYPQVNIALLRRYAKDQLLEVLVQIWVRRLSPVPTRGSTALLASLLREEFPSPRVVGHVPAHYVSTYAPPELQSALTAGLDSITSQTVWALAKESDLTFAEVLAAASLLNSSSEPNPSLSATKKTPTR